MRDVRKGAVATCLNAKDADGVGTVVDVSRYRHVHVAVIGANTPSMTLKAQGSMLMSSDANLDFSAAADGDNPWDYVGMYDLNDGQFKDGDTGISVAAGVQQFTINTDALRSLNFEVSGLATGDVTVKVFPVTNG